MVSHPVCWNIYFATNVQQELCPTTKIPVSRYQIFGNATCLQQLSLDFLPTNFFWIQFVPFCYILGFCFTKQLQ